MEEADIGQPMMVTAALCDSTCTADTFPPPSHKNNRWQPPVWMGLGRNSPRRKSALSSVRIVYRNHQEPSGTPKIRRTSIYHFYPGLWCFAQVSLTLMGGDQWMVKPFFGAIKLSVSLRHRKIYQNTHQLNSKSILDWFKWIKLLFNTGPSTAAGWWRVKICEDLFRAVGEARDEETVSSKGWFLLSI